MPRIRSMMTAAALFFSGVILTVTACAGLFTPVPSPMPSLVPPSATAVLPTETLIPLYQQVKLNTSSWEEQGQSFGYKITVQVPVLVGSNDPRVLRFNAEMTSLVNKAVADFKQNLANLPPTPYSNASTFDLRYNLVSPPGNILSIKFDIHTYYTGAAHPAGVSQTVNFDLQQGKDLNLGDLFVADADYLAPISKYCIDQLSGRDIGFDGFELGATATPENYRNWNITADGLMITFDEYQVAPYAAGPQTVVIPYNQLNQFIEPRSPLAVYLH